MKDTLTPAQIASYRDQGFLIIENFLDARELEQWRAATDDAVRERLKNTGWKGLNNQGEQDDAFYKQVFIQCIKLADTHAAMRALIFDERLGRLAGTLAGVDGIRIWHDQALIKPPYGNPTAWHLDDPYWSFSSRDALSIWVALDDATLSNGCMAYLPGTHHEARYENVGIGANFGGLFNVYPEWKKRAAVLAPIPAGSCALHNGLTAHAAGANMTNRPRRAMTCAYMPDGSTFNGQKNVLPEDYLATLKVGDVLNNDRINKLIWHK
jgi:ectoine hydroxylase-related dioxygenase (phytanoyl-CoA dioxygenase family)